MKAYGARYLSDLRAFAKSYLLSLVAILPLVLLNVGAAFGMFVYLILFLLGAPVILAVAMLTAVFENYGYKLLIYLLVVGGLAYGFRELPSAQITGPSFNALVFGQVSFLQGLFFLIVERGKIGAWIMRYVRAES